LTNNKPFESIIDEDPTLLPAALGDIARARGMTELSRKTGLAREALYRSLSENGNPRYSTVCKILSAYGTKMRITSDASLSSPA